MDTLCTRGSNLAYSQAQYWKNFKNIVEEDATFELEKEPDEDNNSNNNDMDDDNSDDNNNGCSLLKVE